MKASIELLQIPAEFSSIRCIHIKSGFFPFNWHYHPEYELTLILKGNGTRLIGDKVHDYSAGDLVFLGSKLPHCWYSEPSKNESDEVEALVIQFSVHVLDAFVDQIPELRNVSVLKINAVSGIQFPKDDTDKVARIMLEVSELEGIRQLLRLYELLDFLSTRPGTRLISTPNYKPILNKHAEAKLSDVFDFIHRHYMERFSLLDCATIVNMNDSGFSRFFKNHVGQTFSDYVISYRIKKACEQLIETDLNVSEIAYNCGFNNLSNFNRLFLSSKKITPLVYRKKFLEKKSFPLLDHRK